MSTVVQAIIVTVSFTDRQTTLLIPYGGSAREIRNEEMSRTGHLLSSKDHEECQFTCQPCLLIPTKSTTSYLQSLHACSYEG